MKVKYFVLWLIAVTLSGCQSRHETEIAGETQQGTTYHIKLVLNGVAVSPDEVRRDITLTLSEIDAKLSNDWDDSEISHINAQKTTDWLPVSSEIVQLLGVTQIVYEQSHGCYDLTTKPVFDLWKDARRENRIPSQKEIDVLLPHTGMPLLELDMSKQRIRKKDPKLEIDLSSIAQGYSVSAISHRLEAMGIKNYLVEIGNDMMMKGHNANGNNWRVNVVTSKPLAIELQHRVDKREQDGVAIATEGAYRSLFEISGQSYLLIINPKSGWPVVQQLRSITVMHSDPIWADAWHSALLCVGEREAARIAEAQRLQVLLVYNDVGKLTDYMSNTFVAQQ